MSFSEASASKSAVSRISSVFTLPSFSTAPKKSSKKSPSSLSKWSDAMCVSVEERFFSCVDKGCVMEDDDTLAGTTESLTFDEQQSIISTVKRKKPKSVTTKTRAKNKPKSEAKPDLAAAAALAAHQKQVNDNIKSYNFLANYHSSRQDSTKPEEINKNTKDLTQGNHRGWGASTPKKEGAYRKKFAANMMIRNKNKTASAKTNANFHKENPLSSDDDTFDRTDDDYTYDSHTCSDDSETCGDTATYEGTVDSSLFPEDETYTDGSSYTSYGQHVRKNERDPLSRNDSLQSSERRKNRPDDVALERELPSFGSKVDAMASANERHRSFASAITRSSIDSANRYATPSYAVAETISQKPKAAKKVPSPPPLPPPVELVLKSTSKSTYNYGDSETVVTTTTSSSSSDSYSYSASLISGSMQSKKIALGKSQIKAKNLVGMTPEMATTKPKVFPYLINHSLFQQNLENKKKKSRALSSNAAEF